MYLIGLDERITEACSRAGLSKLEVAKRCGFNRKVLYNMKSMHNAINSGYLAKICSVTKTDASWMLGLVHGEWRELK